jgi:hypothetical protein
MWALDNKGVHVASIWVSKDVYGMAKTKIAIFNQAVMDFPMNIWLHK